MGRMTLTLVSLQVGLPRRRGVPGAENPAEREWESGIFKEPVPGPVGLAALGLDGDGVADPRFHGGPDKAVNVYPSTHYASWESELGLGMRPGAFGENFTVSGADEHAVNVGDVFAGGGVRVQVTQPRQPCWKLARRWGLKDLPVRVARSLRTGWYFRVLEGGEVAPGLVLDRVGCPNPEWSVARAFQAMDWHKDDVEAARGLLACEGLSESWRGALEARLGIVGM